MLSKNIIKNDLFKNFVSLDEKKVEISLRDKINRGEDIKEIIHELRSALFEIGKLFEKETYFIPDLIFAGEIMRNCNKILEPYINRIEIEKRGTIILGTVFGDVHDLGKNLVKMLLENSGFEVIDLGVNVSPGSFTEEIKKRDAKLIGLSCLLTMSFNSINDTVELIKKEGLRDKIKIMIGGAPVTELVRKKTGCDYYCKDAYEGVKTAFKIYG
jgi:methylmalonyl-CoA mutase cobalamin-binding domain/chain